MLVVHACTCVGALLEHLGRASLGLFLIPAPGQQPSVRADFQHGGKQRP